MTKYKLNRLITFILIIFMSTSFSGCVDQHPNGKNVDADVFQDDVELALEITDPVEKRAVELARAKVQLNQKNQRIVATSPAVAQIFDKLELDLVGVADTKVSVIPDRYKDVTRVGMAMNPDMELISSLEPDWIFSPSSLKSDLEPKYKQLDTDYGFLNLRSVKGMYRSIQELGEIFNKRNRAKELIKEFNDFYEEYRNKNKDKKHPKVLILMGLPGSYIIATENSYVGNLVELAGGINVYANTNKEFLTVNTEDMKTKEPDIILRAAHALPQQVKEMFDKDFKTNDIWKHFDAVKENRVYDLSYDKFGMSATFLYTQALEELQPILYP